MHHKLIFFISILFSNLLFSATTEQILQYLSLSHSEQQIIGIEQVFDAMRQRQEQNESIESNKSTSQVGIVYQEYLEEHLSSDEIEELLALYRLPVMERYVSEVKTLTINEDDMKAYLESLKETPLTTEREDIIEEIVFKVINKKLQRNFYRSMMQRYIKKADTNKTQITSNEQKFIESMSASTKNRLLYGTQIFNLEEMKELKNAIGSSIFSKVKKVENEALIEIMNDYIQGVSSQPKRLRESKPTT